MRIITQCSVCHKKDVSELRHSALGKTRFITLSCGHTYTEELIASPDSLTPDEIYLKDNRKLYPFQVAGVKFIEQSNFRCQISDEMGLGKTIQAIASIERHFDELAPILIVVKASLTYNWMREILLGTGRISQVFESGDKVIPGIKILIVSFDTVTPRKSRVSNEVDESNLIALKSYKPKTIIIDECQMIKSHSAKRTNALREIIREKIKIKEDVTPKLNPRLIRLSAIAQDLINYHGLGGRFALKINTLSPNVLGLCRCKVTKEGIIVGEIVVSKYHAEKDPEEQIIETILHEIAHGITPGAGHRNIWRETSLAIGGDGKAIANCEGTSEITDVEPMVKHIVSLSGTPIKNNALEYFPILNILRPEMFPNLDTFERQHVDYYWNGRGYKAGGIKYPEEFISKTKDFIIRRTRDEVMPELPKILRDFKYYPLSEQVKRAYSKQVKELDDYMNLNEDLGGNEYYTNILSYLTKMRHLTGIAKIEPVIDYVNEYLEGANGETPKLVIFHHHIDVGDILAMKIPEIPFKGANTGLIRMTSADSSIIRLEKIDEFKFNTNLQVMLIPTLAGGEGINLQFCHNVIILEREWNPANEEQAEGRFSRIGSVANSINVTYPVATGTIDEYFAELVEIKRENVSKSLDGTGIKWSETDIIRDLAKIVVKKWKM